MSLLEEYELFKSEMIEKGISEQLKQHLENYHFEHSITSALFPLIGGEGDFSDLEREVINIFGGEFFFEMVKKYKKEAKRQIVDLIKEKVDEVIFEKILRTNWFKSSVFTKEERIRHIVSKGDKGAVFLEKEDHQREITYCTNMYISVIEKELELISEEEFVERYMVFLKSIYESPFHKHLKDDWKWELHVVYKNSHEFVRKNEKAVKLLLQKLKKWYEKEKHFEIETSNIYNYTFYYLMTDKQHELFLNHHEKGIRETLEMFKKVFNEKGIINEYDFENLKDYIEFLETFKAKRHVL